MLRAANAYLQTNVNTTSPGEVIIMLYDGAIKFLNQAKELIDAKDYAGKGIAISRATDIISELSAVLNSEKGGDLAENLHKLYFWCNSKLAMANLKLDNSLIDIVIQVLSGLRSAYAQIQELPEVQSISSQLASKQEQGNANLQSRQITHQVQTDAPSPSQVSGIRGRNAYSKMAQSS